MESSRDSSVWQTLAVTFGGGLALGAVGMKLTQNVRRPGEAPPEAPPADGRFDQIERRLARLERSPASGAPLDQRALEAIVGAVDARLQEQALNIDGQITGLEARLEARLAAEVAAVRTEDAAAAEAAKARIQEVQSQFLEQMLILRTAVVDELNHFGEAVSQLIAEQVSVELDARSHSIEQTIDTRIAAAAGAAAAAAMEEYLAPLRAEVGQKERELAEVRNRLGQSEQNVLEVVLAIGQVCRQAAERISGPARPPAVTPVERVAEAAPPAPTPTPIAPVQPAGESGESSGITPPSFAQSPSASRLWRIPLVSALFISTTGILLMHYL